LLVFLGKALNGILLSGYTGSRWQLDSKTEKVTSLSLGRGTLTNTKISGPQFETTSQ